MNQRFLFLQTSLRFYSALAFLELQIYVVVEQFGAENISLLSGRLFVLDFQNVVLFFRSELVFDESQQRMIQKFTVK